MVGEKFLQNKNVFELFVTRKNIVYIQIHLFILKMSKVQKHDNVKYRKFCFRYFYYNFELVCMCI